MGFLTESNTQKLYRLNDVYDIAKYPGQYDGIFAQAVLLHIPKDKIRGVLKDLKEKIKTAKHDIQ